MVRRLNLAFALLLLTAACDAPPDHSSVATPRAEAIAPIGPSGAPANLFPKPARPIARITSDQWSDEESRDRAHEAARVMDLLGVHEGTRVADIGAGTGYYTVRLARRVGPSGRVYAEDIIPSYLARLSGRVEALRLSQVTLALGAPHDPRLPPNSLDLALLVHMYHEIEQPFGLLWNLHASLRPGARIAIVDSDRPTAKHGTPPTLLACELAAAGYAQVEFHDMPDAGGYLAVFAPKAERPKPEAIRPCGR